MPNSDDDGGMRLRFWGVRGSLPTPGPTTLRYGGNTPCVSLHCGPHLVILDAGSGMRDLGEALGAGVDADVLLSHAHIDHICGLPFFRPAYDPTARLRVWGGGLVPAEGIEAAVARSLRAPMMPNLDAAFRARVDYHDIVVGAPFDLQPGLRIATIALDHPGGSLGFRITWGGASLCYLTDAEQRSGRIDPALVRFVAGTDLLICDATYTEPEYASRVGWGHSTWKAALGLAAAGGTGPLVLFHHDPSRNDDALDAIAATAAALRPGTLVAREGMEIALRGGSRDYSS